MNPRTKFLVAALAIALPAVSQMASSIKTTGVYHLTLTELDAGVGRDASPNETGVKLGGAHSAPSPDEYRDIQEIPSGPAGVSA